MDAAANVHCRGIQIHFHKVSPINIIFSKRTRVHQSIHPRSTGEHMHVVAMDTVDETTPTPLSILSRHAPLLPDGLN